MLNRYLLWFIFPFVVATIICGLFDNFFLIAIFLTAFSAISVVCLIRKRAKIPAVLLIAGIGFSIIWQSIYFNDDKIPPELLSGENTFKATVTSFLEETASGEKNKFRVKYFLANKEIDLIVYSEKLGEELSPGDEVRITAKVFGFENTEAFAEKTYYKSRHLDALANASSVELISHADGSRWFYFSEYAAKYMKDMTDKVFTENGAAFLKALILGDTSELSDEFSDQLKSTGMSHAVSVSGMHISFIVGFIIFFTKNKYIRILAIPLMFAFAVMVGASQSALRAAIMQTLVLIADIKKREYDSMTAISLAAFILVFANPYCATDIAFLLSFSATLGIILLFPKLFSKISSFGKNLDGAVRKIYNILSSVVSVSLAASLFTSPITALTFNSVSLIAPLSNVILSIPITMAFSAGVLSVLLGFLFLPIGKVVAIFPEVVIKFIMNTIKFLSNFKYSQIFTGDTVVILAICFVCILAIYSILAGRKKVRPLFSVILLILFLVGVISLKSSETAESSYVGVRFDVLDVGQGQCLIATSGEECVVVDCGGESDADYIAASHLIKRGIYDIDALILTHAHSDHANGVGYLVDTIKTKTVYMPASDRENSTFIKLEKSIGEMGKTVYVEDDISFCLADMKISVLTLPEGKDENENGLVVLISDGEYEMLITGDIPSKLEKFIAPKLPDCEAYIVGHHGSGGSSSQALLNKTLPELCIISVGEGNSYGHPSGETLEKLRAIGAEIKRTDLDGTITVYSRR